MQRDGEGCIVWEIGDLLLDRYKVAEIIPGGMGTVYVAEDLEGEAWRFGGLRSDDRIAVKSVNHRMSAAGSALETLLREATLWIQLERHWNIIDAYFIEVIDEQPHIFMEYANKGNLRTWLRTGENEVCDAILLATHICRGLEHTFARGVCAHGDLKPENVLLTQHNITLYDDEEITAKVGDFGLASSFSDFACRRNSLIGSLPYMAPELFSDVGQKSAFSDIYAFGAVLFEMFTGRVPYDASSYRRFKEAHIKGCIPNVRDSRPEVPMGVAEAISRCLAKDQCSRFESFDEIRAILMNEIESVDARSFRLSEITVSESISPPDLLQRADSLLSLGELTKAIDYYDAVIDYKGKNKEPFMMLTQEEYEEFQQRALTPYQECQVHAFVNRGAALVKQGELGDASSSFSQALLLAPDTEVAWVNQLNLWQKVFDGETIVGTANRALQHCPDSSDLHLLKGKALLEVGEFMDAVACFDEALERQGDWCDALRLKGVALAGAGDLLASAEAFRHSAELDPGDLYSWLNLASCCLAAERFDEALQACDNALELDATNSHALALRAELHH